MKKHGLPCEESRKEELTRVQIAMLIMAAISLTVNIVSFVLEVFGDKLKGDEDLIGYDRYDYDPSDICDTDDELDF